MSDVPIFLMHLVPVLVKNNSESATLQCIVQSNPLAQIHWHKNGKRLYNGSNFDILENVMSQDDYNSVLNSSLYIRALNKRDSANYTCIPQNIIGSKKVRGRLIVQCEYKMCPQSTLMRNLSYSISTFSIRHLSFICETDGSYWGLSKVCNFQQRNQVRYFIMFCPKLVFPKMLWTSFKKLPA